MLLRAPNDLATLRNYYSQITLIDDAVGRLVAAADAAGDTLVIFTSDHGLSLGHHGFWGHGASTSPSNLHRAAHSIPLIARQPGRIEIGAGRIGDDWSASGDAELATVRFVALGDDPGPIQIVSGGLVNSAFQGVPLRVNKVEALPQIAQLHPNFPNPFNPSTEIRFAIPTARDVKLRIYNQLGQTIRTLVDNRMKAGNYALKWDGTDNQGLTVASGVYFYSLEAGDFSQIRKMTLLK